MSAFYNEIDPYAAAWLRNLIAAGHIAPGVVDERSIEDIEPAELAQYTQCHFFAGIGAWSHALRLAGWPDDRPVWTGSCPCQPFSSAGKGAGFADERHLWPAFHWLISQCRPPVVLGEQVASPDGLKWLNLVQADLEGSGYATGAADLCAAGVGAPHIRQRLWWVGKRLADADGSGGRASGRLAGCGDAGSLDDALGARLEGQRGGYRGAVGHGPGTVRSASAASQSGGLDDAAGARHIGPVEGAEGNPRDEAWLRLPREGRGQDRPDRPGPTNGLWRAADWLFCRDGKWRPVEPGTFPLAHGAPARVGRLRAYGNAIVAQVAQAFIEAVMSPFCRVPHPIRCGNSSQCAARS